MRNARPGILDDCHTEDVLLALRNDQLKKYRRARINFDFYTAEEAHNIISHIDSQLNALREANETGKEGQIS